MRKAILAVTALALLLSVTGLSGTTALADGNGPAYTALAAKAPQPPAGLAEAAERIYQEEVWPVIRQSIAHYESMGTSGGSEAGSLYPTYEQYTHPLLIGPLPVLKLQEEQVLKDVSEVPAQFEPQQYWTFIAVAGEKGFAHFGLSFSQGDFHLDEIIGTYPTMSLYACAQQLDGVDLNKTLLLKSNIDTFVLAPDDRVAIMDYWHSLSFDQLACVLVQQKNTWEHSAKAGNGCMAEYLMVHGVDLYQPAFAPIAGVTLPIWLWLPVGFLAGAAAGLAAGWLLRAARQRKANPH